ncbi:Thymidylate synthase [Tetrabaena socialis]|uniref:Thymidylate synthase n=1 Tax=Tetrabaena socialis TaxID=47790 RepID=A0A2J7ZL73_9CHLO|nr:Thymidylate synthase [Tetrabaena socialis]|eukprot:PNH01012.1 Thymidylate synthase [Tetrabaena socialis]
MGDPSRLDAIAFEPFSEIMLRCGNVELKALAGCNRALRDHVAKFMESPALVADLLVATHGEHRAIQRIYFDSVYNRFSKNMRSGAACQVVRDGKSPELMSILGGHNNTQLRYGLLRDALLCHDLPGAQYLYLVRVGPFALSPFWVYRHLLDDGVVLAAICNGPEAFCIGTLLPRCRSELIVRKATDEALSVALRRGRARMVSYVIERCYGESESADRSKWRIKHARAVARAGGTVDEFRFVRPSASDSSFSASVSEGERGYLDLLRDVRQDRTGTGTISVFGRQLRFDLTCGRMPMMTTRLTSFMMVALELLWFLKGCTDTRVLAGQGVRIWDGKTASNPKHAHPTLDPQASVTSRFTP